MTIDHEDSCDGPLSPRPMTCFNNTTPAGKKYRNAVLAPDFAEKVLGKPFKPSPYVRLERPKEARGTSSHIIKQTL